MQLSVKAFGLTAAIVGAVAAFITAVLAILIPSWGEPLMDQVAAVAPGVTGANWRSAVLIALYMAIDGFAFGGGVRGSTTDSPQGNRRVEGEGGEVA